jgi:hypothetical protein
VPLLTDNFASFAWLGARFRIVGQNIPIAFDLPRPLRSKPLNWGSLVGGSKDSWISV